MKIAIYQTSDLHGFVFPTNYVKEVPLGILKIGTYILEDEKKYDGAIKIDCGDLIQGSSLTHYLSKTHHEINPIIECMKKIGFTTYTLGNHEFNYGLDYLTKAYKAVEDKVVNGNIVGLPFNSKPYEIININGFKIGVIGLTTAFIPNWEQPSNIEGVTFINPVDAYEKYEEELKAQSDFIIVAYHGGFERSLKDNTTPTETLNKENQGSELLEKFSSINMILSGHQHRSFIENIKGRICTQPLQNGQNFSKIIIDTDSEEISYELIDVSKLTVGLNKDLSYIFKDVNEGLENYLNKVIGEFPESLLIENLFDVRLEGHPLINFLHRVQLEATGADISVMSLFDTAIGFKNKVTVRDVLINYPYPNTTMVLKVTGEKIKEAIEKAATYFVLEQGKATINQEFLVPKIQNYNYDTFGGITYEIDLKKDFYKRVSKIKFKGEELDLNKTYLVAMNNYRATNTSVYPCYEGAEVALTIDKDFSQIIMEYFEKHPKVSLDKERNYFIN